MSIAINLFEFFWIIAFALTFWHFSKKTSKKDALIFFIPAFLWGFFAEFTGANFYDLYTYPQNYLLILFNVPLSIAFGWAAIIYIGYYITTQKFHVKKLLNINVETAAISTAFDLIILEPLAFFYKFWNWKQNNFWFGAPFFNFVGWFLVITIFVASYNFVTKRTQNKNKQFLYFLGVLVLGMIVLQAFTISYLTLIGPF